MDRSSTAEVARRVRAFRGQARLTQEELARAAKVTPKFVSQLENGHVNASIAVLQRVVEDGLKMTLATFFATDGDGEMDDLAGILVLLAQQPVSVRRRAIRLVRALLEEDA